MAYIAVDLGTTNIKTALFDRSLNHLATFSESVLYRRNEGFVEFDPSEYYHRVTNSVRTCVKQAGISPSSVTSIVLTGQAESLVLVDESGNPLYNGISWMDERSVAECEELRNRFPEERTYPFTGQPGIIPTWPITKILWLKRNRPDVFSATARFLMLKDYIQYRLTGVVAGEYSIYNFTHYFDIRRKSFWPEILEYCGVSNSRLPELVEPCTDLGHLTGGAAETLGLTRETTLNTGTLDHFAGMIGTGNISPGLISESTGTVLSIATLVEQPLFSETRIPCHYGPFEDRYVLLPVCESGGISLEWYKNNFAEQSTFEELGRELENRDLPNELVFLPYITGVNTPELNPDARGVFYGIRMKHDRFDFAYAVMEGVASLLKKNLDFLETSGIEAATVISTGGGARSRLWSQLKADISGYTVAIPEHEEAACLGAAMIGAVAGGDFSSYREAVTRCVSIKETFSPNPSPRLDAKYRLFEELYTSLLPVFTRSSAS